VVVVGYTAKSTPLLELPMEVPPLETVYQLMVFPAEVAFRFEATPQVMVEGLAVTLAGCVGGPTVRVTGVLVFEAHVTATELQETITWPFPDLAPAVMVWLVPEL
jgi:hypothetical protein